MKLAVYTICKNEIKFVDKWVENVLPADYIVVLDTGSTDGTYEKLLDYQSRYPDKIIVGQKTYETFRFDVARNDNLDLVPEDTDIYLSTDLDELITSSGWVEEFKKIWVPGKTQRASYKYIWSHTDNGGPGRIFHYNKAHSKEWRWFAPVHELLKSTVTGSEHYDSSISVNLFDKVTLEHFPDRTKSRGSYLPLLKLRKEEDPNDSYGIIYLCHELHYRGLYQESIDELQGALDKFYGEYTSTERASCYLFMGDDYRALGKINEAIISYQRAIFEDRTYREPYFNLAKVLMDKGDFFTARGVIEQGIKNSYRHFSWLERDTSWSYEPYDLLCLACYYSGDYPKALLNAKKALELNPDSERLQKNVELCNEAYIKICP